MVKNYLLKSIVKLFLAFICFSGFSQTTSIKQLLNYPENTVLVAAHRGDNKNFPENSLIGIQSCINKRIDIIEVDVQRTKDNRFVLMHDPTINRTTNGKGLVNNYTLEELKKYRLKEPDGKYGNEKIPSLEEVLFLAKDKVIINLDKSSRYFDDLLTIIDSLGLRHSVILKSSKKDNFINKTSENPDGPLFMPILKYMPKESIDSILMIAQSAIVEIILENDTSYLSEQEGLDLFRNEKYRIWYNAMSKSLSLGYSEKQDAIGSWENLIEHQAFIIQTDYPFQLMQHLIDKGLHPMPEGWQEIDLTDLPKEVKQDSTLLINPSVNTMEVKNATQNNIVKPKTKTIYYIIKSGDTLTAIAKKYKTTVQAICKLNKDLKPSSNLKIGSKIRVI